MATLLDVQALGKLCPRSDQLAGNRSKVCKVCEFPQRAGNLPVRGQLGQEQNGMILQQGDGRSPRQN